MKRFFLIMFIICTLLFNIFFISAKEYKVAVNKISTTDYYVKLVEALAEATNNTFNYEVVPRARCIYLIENKEVDFQVPNSLMPSANQAELKFDYSKVTLMKIAYVLYTNKKKNIPINELKKGNAKKYFIETDTSLVNAFGFTASPSTNIEASLMKVENGTIDGLIYSQPASDPILKKIGAKNIKRQLYDSFELKIAIQKGAQGGEVDKLLSEGINKLKASGKYQEIMGELIKQSEYNNWQP